MANSVSSINTKAYTQLCKYFSIDFAHIFDPNTNNEDTIIAAAIEILAHVFSKSLLFKSYVYLTRLILNPNIEKVAIRLEQDIIVDARPTSCGEKILVATIQNIKPLPEPKIVDIIMYIEFIYSLGNFNLLIGVFMSIPCSCFYLNIPEIKPTKNLSNLSSF